MTSASWYSHLSKSPPTTQLFYVTYRIWQKGWHVTSKIQFKGTGDLIALSWIVRSVGSQLPCQEDTQAGLQRGPHGEDGGLCWQWALTCQLCEWAVLGSRSPGLLQLAAALVHVLITTSWEKPSCIFLLKCSWSPNPQILCKIINVYYRFILLSFGVICYPAIENYYRIERNTCQICHSIH